MSEIYGVLVILLITIITVIESKTAELRFVNVVFRHGDRAPEAREFYPTDPHKHNDFFPMGLGGLTNVGKKRQHDLGVTLRNRYNNFLGSVYIPEDIATRSTDFKRTKMSLTLVLAGLYPPTPVQKWHPKIDWQPIPTSYVPRSFDDLLIPEHCPRYLEELKRVESLPEIVNRVDMFRPLMNNLTIHTGKLINDTSTLFILYHGLMAEKSMGLKLPDWANDVFPNADLFDSTVLRYDIINYNDMLKKLNGGKLLKRFIDDMLATVNGTKKEAQKMNLFSGHEGNIVGLLKILGAYESHIPQYTSAVIVELLEKDSNYYVKVLYYLGIPSTITELRIPGCNVLCSLDDFLKLLNKVTPQNDELDCPTIGPLLPPV